MLGENVKFMKIIKKRLLTILSGILCLMLTMSLLALFLFSSVCINFTSKSINRYIISSEYSQNVSSKILEELYSYADINNLPHDIFNEFINLDLFVSNIYEYIVSLSADSVDNKYISDINNRKAHLTQKVKTYVLENMSLTPEQTANIDNIVNDFVNKSADIYINNMKSNILQKMFTYTSFIDKYYLIIFVALILLTLAISSVLIFTQKWKHKGYRHILYCLISSDLTMILLILYIAFSDLINRITITNRELYILINQILKGCLTGLYISTLIISVLIFVFGYIYVRKRKDVL